MQNCSFEPEEPIKTCGIGIAKVFTSPGRRMQPSDSAATVKKRIGVGVEVTEGVDARVAGAVWVGGIVAVAVTVGSVVDVIIGSITAIDD
jgi:hypothetical protein